MRRVLVEIPLPFTGKILPIYSYGVMLMLGFLAALFLAKRRARRVGMDPTLMLDVALVTLLCGVFGARLFYVIEFRETYAQQGGGLLHLFKVWEGGLVFYGGFLCATVGILLFARVKRLSLARLLDVLAPSVMIGLAFGRVGCFLNGCCYGRPTHIFCAVRFPPGSLAYQPPNALPEGTAIHPTQLYSSLGALVIYAVLEIYFRKQPRPGRVANLLCILYPAHRFLVEFLRADTHEPLKWTGTLTAADLQWKALSVSQKVSLAVLLIAGTAWIAGRFRRATEAAPASRSERRAEERHRKKRQRTSGG